MRGDDGRVHLVRAGLMVCADAQSDNGWVHRTSCGWIERGAGPEEWKRRSVIGEASVWRSRECEWTVLGVGAELDLAVVEHWERCPFGGPHWPPPPARTRSIRILRAALVAEFGPDCQLCGLYPGEMVDHDHEIGYVRGLLCRFCNRTVEECPHVTGCPKADYLLRPPAFRLRLLYPVSQEWRTKESTLQRKIAQLGFDPFEGLHPRRASLRGTAPEPPRPVEEPDAPTDSCGGRLAPRMPGSVVGGNICSSIDIEECEMTGRGLTTPAVERLLQSRSTRPLSRRSTGPAWKAPAPPGPLDKGQPG